VWQGKVKALASSYVNVTSLKTNLFAGFSPAWQLQFTEENGHRSHPLSLSFARFLSLGQLVLGWWFFLLSDPSWDKEKGPLNPFRI
jgi:hypothetical protein